MAEQSYELMHKDDVVASLQLDDLSGAILKVTPGTNPELLPLGGSQGADSLRKWWLRRAVPISQGNIAALLQQEGIDAGLLSVGEKYCARREYFDSFRENYALSNDVYEIEVNKEAKILSNFISFDERDDEKSRSIGAYYYKNKEGQQFLVFAFAAYEQSWRNDNFYRSYARSRQLKEAIDLFGGEKLPAYSYGNPDLYIIAKKAGNSMSVGLWNIFPDEIFEPILDFPAIHLFAFLYRILDFTHNLKKNRL